MKDKVFSGLKYFFLSLSVALTTSVLIFPYGDIKDKIISIISEQTNDQVLIDFEELQFSFFPLGFQATNVEADLGSIFPAPLKAKSLRVRPNASVLRLSPGGYIDGKIFGGNLSINGSQTGADEKGLPSFGINLDAENIHLENLVKDLAPLILRNFKSPLKLKGKLNLEGDLDFDTSLARQPSMELDLTAKALKILGGSIKTPSFPIDLPKLDLNHLEIEANLDNGKLRIEKLEIKGNQNSINGEISGFVDIRLAKAGRNIRTVITKYDLEIDLKVNPNLYDELYFLRLASAYKSSAGNLDRYRLKVTGSGTNRPPNITKL